MKLLLSVREQTFPVEVKEGNQDFKWLGVLACYHYARSQKLRFKPTQFHPTNVTDEEDRVLFPKEQICDRLKDNDTVVVEILGPRTCPDSVEDDHEMSLWERYAFTDNEEWVDVIFKFETGAGVEIDPTSPPLLIGNFNAWETPIPLRQVSGGVSSANEEDGSGGEGGGKTRYEHRQLIPAHTHIVFKFAFNGKEHLSHQYEVVNDEAGNEMNYFKVKPPPPNYKKTYGTDGGSVDFSGTRNPSEGVKTFSKRIVGRFEPVREMTQEIKDKLFEADWKKMQFADVVRLKEEREKIKVIMYEHFPSLKMIFQFFSSHGGGDICAMSVLEFIHFCHTCEIPDRHVTINKIDRVFRRVNIEEEFDEEMIEQNPNNYRNAMKIVPDPFNPRNQFIRGEFMESLIRLAIKKFGTLPIDTAVRKIIEKHVIPFGLAVAKDDIRRELLRNDVQSVYKKYAKRLHKLYNTAARLDKTDQDFETINLKEFELLLQHHDLFDADVSRRAAFSAFAMSQDASTTESDNYEMVYGEFLEVLGRIAKIKYDDDQPLSDKLENLMQVFFAKSKKSKKKFLLAV